MLLSAKFAAPVFLTPCVIAVGLVRWWFAPRGLNARAFATLPLVGLASSLVAMVIQFVFMPDNLKQRVADIAILSATGAISEEFVKTVGLACVLRRKRATVTDTTSIVATGMLVGLGFSFSEALVRTIESTARHLSWYECLGRAVVSTPGHAVYTGVVAWMIARRSINPDRVGGVAVGFGLAVVAHFAFDAIGLAPQLADHAWPVETACRAAQGLIVWGLLVTLLRLPASHEECSLDRFKRRRVAS